MLSLEKPGDEEKLVNRDNKVVTRHEVNCGMGFDPTCILLQFGYALMKFVSGSGFILS